MRAIYQRLKELDRETFEKFCLHLLKERHPVAEIRHVDGSHGDKGIDLFCGDLEGSPVIWQCKHFPNGVGKSQRTQIKHSLKEALKHFRPSAWILCIPVDMNVETHEWFQTLAKSYQERVDIKLMQGTDMAHELVHRQSLRDQFFPDAVIETMHLRQMLCKTAELTTEELASVTADNVDHYIDRLKQRDARFNYEIVFSRDIAPGRHAPRPGLIASIADDNKTINIFARDVEALKRQPPGGMFSLQGTGVDKFKELMKTGRPQHLDPGEIVGFTSEFCSIVSVGPFIECHLEIGPCLPGAKESLHLRVTFGNGEMAVVYDWMEFVIARQGTEEIELVSRGDIPFELRMTFKKDLAELGEFNIYFRWKDAEVRAVQKAIRATDQLLASRQFELFDLRTSKRLCSASISGMTDPFAGNGIFREFVTDLTTVADHYGVDLRVPQVLTREDLDTLSLLVSMSKGQPQDVRSINMTLTKSVHMTPEVRQMLRGVSSFLITQPEMTPRPRLFGVEIPTGQLIWHIPSARVKSAASVEKGLAGVAVGEALSVTLLPIDPVRTTALGTGSADTADQTRRL